MDGGVCHRPLRVPGRERDPVPLSCLPRSCPPVIRPRSRPSRSEGLGCSTRAGRPSRLCSGPTHLDLHLHPFSADPEGALRSRDRRRCLPFPRLPIVILPRCAGHRHGRDHQKGWPSTTIRHPVPLHSIAVLASVRDLSFLFQGPYQTKLAGQSLPASSSRSSPTRIVFLASALHLSGFARVALK